jgi:hypothetical protein
MSTAPIYDPTLDEVRRDPFPLYARLQDEDPVHWSPAMRSWIVTRYDDVRAVALTRDMSPNRLTPFYETLRDERREMLAEVMRYLTLWLVFRDPPEHTRLRKLLNGVFTPAAIAAMRPSIERTVDEVLAAVDASRPVDLVREVAMLVPGYVILDMLAIPRAHFAMIKEWSDDMRTFIGSSRAEPDRYERVRRGAHEMAAYFRALIDQRRAAPGEDFVSRMIAARDEADALTEDELVATCMLVLFGGHETTTNLIATATNALLDHPEQAALLRERPEIVESAVEELLRYDGPSTSIARVVGQDHELGGRPMKKGERVFAMINAANRDPRRFDAPRVLDLQRSPNRHLTFGQGIHFCLGAPLARLEGQVCLSALVQRFPRMRRADGEVQWIDAMIMRGLVTLPVQLA